MKRVLMIVSLVSVFGVVFSSEQLTFTNPSIDWQVLNQQGEKKVEESFNKFFEDLNDSVGKYCSKNKTNNCWRLVAYVNYKKSFIDQNGLTIRINNINQEMPIGLTSEEKTACVNKIMEAYNKENYQ